MAAIVRCSDFRIGLSVVDMFVSRLGPIVRAWRHSRFPEMLSLWNESLSGQYNLVMY
jgi:hypothetical protein